MNRFFKIVCALILLYAPATAHALLNGTALVNHPDLVRLEFKNQASVCTGFFINSTTLITAAHCLFEDYSPHKIWTPESASIVGELNTPLKIKVKLLIPHPDYYPDGWSPHDVGIIKTSPYETQDLFQIEDHSPTWVGSLLYFGCGRTVASEKQYSCGTGKNYFIQLGSFLFSLGRLTGTATPGNWVSIAPNDSGAPILNLATGKVVSIASKSTAVGTQIPLLPVVSVSTVLTEESNARFIDANSH